MQNHPVQQARARLAQTFSNARRKTQLRTTRSASRFAGTGHSLRWRFTARIGHQLPVICQARRLKSGRWLHE
jgi:hypothetical protein